MDPIADIKNRLPIEQLVSQYVQLKKSGRNYKALCPFHKERTPSFHVSSEKQLAYCFGCHKGGDHFKFIEEIEGLDFVGALKFLAEKTGVDLPKMQPQDKTKKTQRDRLIELHEEAADFYQERLEKTDEGEKVMKYLKKRGLKGDTIAKARLGFAPETGNALFNYLLNKDFTREEIVLSGLCFARDTQNSVFVDRFRLRLLFPIRNLAGNICAFGGRALKDGEEPKYLNSPETPVFHKSSFLYGLSEARAEIRQKNEVIVVEGYMDALTAHQAGFANVVACGGTSLTEDQLVLLKRFTKNVILSFDRDNAGGLATKRAIELAYVQDLSTKVAVWDNDAKDPDECIREKPKDFAEALAEAKPSLDYLIDELKTNVDFGTVEGKRKLTDELLPFLTLINSPVELDAWLQKISLLINLSVSSLYDEIKRFKNKRMLSAKSPKPFDMNTVASDKPKNFQLHEYILGVLLTYPETLGIANQFLDVSDFEDSELQNIYRIITTKYNQSLGASESSNEQLQDFIRNNLTQDELNRVNILSMFAESKVSDMNWETLEQELAGAISVLIKQKYDRKKRELVRKLRDAKDSEKSDLIVNYQGIIEEEENILKKL